MKRFFSSLFLSAFFAVVLFAADVAKPSQKNVYIFGVATSFTDSVAYITELQELEVYVLPNGFLADRSLYSLQFNNYLVAHQGLEGMTCAVFFGKKQSKMVKRYQRVFKRIRQANDVVLHRIATEDFRFEKEDWVEPTVEQQAVTETPDKEKAEKKSKKKR